MAVLLVVMFLVAPVIEIYVIIQVGQRIGVLPTVFLLLAESAVGAWLVKREGVRVWRELTSTLTAGRLPNVEMANAALVLVGGTLLLTPGFVTDILGFVLLLPFTRPVARRALGRVFARIARRSARRRFGGPGFAGPGPTPDRRGRRPEPPRHQPGERIVPGEVLDDPGDRRHD